MVILPACHAGDTSSILVETAKFLIISCKYTLKVDSVLNAFKTAIDGLNTVNTQAKAGIAAKEEEIKAAQTEKEALEAICKKNESVLAKLTAILE